MSKSAGQFKGSRVQKLRQYHATTLERRDLVCVGAPRLAIRTVFMILLGQSRVLYRHASDTLIGTGLKSSAMDQTTLSSLYSTGECVRCLLGQT